MNKIFVNVDFCNLEWGAMIKDSNLGIILFSAPTYQELKRTGKKVIHDYIFWKSSEGEVFPDWIKLGKYSLVFRFDKSEHSEINEFIKENKRVSS